MTVVNPKSISGINSITMASGSDNLLTIHTTNTTERVRVNSDGDVIVGSGITVSPDGDIFATGVTTATTFVGALTGTASGNTTISNNSDNRVITGGSGNALNGEANLTFDGTNLDLGDDKKIRIGASQDLQIFHDAGAGSNIRCTGTKLEIRSDSLILQASNAEKYFVGTADGAVELYHDNTKMIETISTGTNIPDGKFAKFGDSNDMSMGHNTYNYITYTGADFLLTGDATNQIKLQPKSDEAAIICKPNAEVELYHDGTLQCETSANGLAFPSGKGIDFSATSDYTGAGSGTPSELFDDYEEGTWTPRYQTSNGNWSGSMSNQDGIYTKIGDVVHIRFRIHWGSVGGSGNFRITALPFTVKNTSADEGGGVTIGWRSGFNYDQVVSFFKINNQQIQFGYISSSAPYGSFDISVGALASTGYVYCSGTYGAA